MIWFSSDERFNPEPAPHSEGSFEFLDRVAGSYWDQVRDLGNQWVENYPKDHRIDLLGRLKSNRLGDFHPAFWELYLHEYFRKLGFSIEVHPHLPTSNKRPDFLVCTPDSKFYVEAVTVTGGSPHSQSSIEGVIYDAINERITHPRFCLAIREVRAGRSAPPLKLVCQPIQQWLDSLDPENFEYFGKENHKYEDKLVTSVIVDEWIISVEAISLPVGRKQKFGYPSICVYPATGRVVSDYEDIREKLEGKSGKYGEIDKPFVLALQNMLLGSIGDDSQILRALFGDTSPGASCLAKGKLDESYGRSFDSFWVSHLGSRNRRVSAILISNFIHPASVAQSSLTWVTNPWTDFPLSCPLPVRQYNVDTETLHISASDNQEPAFETFGLPENWPIGDRFPRSEFD